MNERRRGRRVLFVLAALLVLLIGGAATEWALRDEGAPAEDRAGETQAQRDGAGADEEQGGTADAPGGTQPTKARGSGRAAPPGTDPPPEPDAPGGGGSGGPAPRPDTAGATAQEPAVPSSDAVPGTAPVELVPPEKQATGSYGIAVGIDGDLAVVGDPDAVVGQAATGAVFVFEKKGAAWVLDARIASPIGGQGDRFGRWVAVSGARVFVSGDRWPRGERSEGAVYVFERGADGWEVSARVGAPSDEKGRGFAGPLSADGVLVLAGNDALASGMSDSGAHLLGLTTGSGWAVDMTFAWKPLDAKEAEQSRIGAGVACAPPFLAVSAVANVRPSRRKGRFDAGRVVVWNVESLARQPSEKPAELELPGDGADLLLGTVAAATSGSRGSLTCRVTAPALADRKTRTPALVTWRLEHSKWGAGTMVPLPDWAADPNATRADDWPWPIATDGRTVVAGLPVRGDALKAREKLPALGAGSPSAIAVFADDGASLVSRGTIVDPGLAAGKPGIARPFGISLALSNGTLIAGATALRSDTPGTAWIISVGGR